MMKSVVLLEMARRFLQPGLEFLVVQVTARVWARQMGKAKLSLRGGVHMTRVHSPWL